MCKHFGRCGGCTFLDISYEEELARKKEFLLDTLGEYGEFLDELHPAPKRDGYRNKMEFAFGDESKDGGLTLGIRKKRNFYEVATPTDCVLIPEDFKIIVKSVIDFFKAGTDTFFHRKRRTGSLRHLILRRGEFTGEILVMLSSTSGLQVSPELLAENLLNTPLADGKIVGILHAVNDGVADVVKNENIKILFGRDYYNEKICGLKFKVSAFSFFQTNSRGAEVLYEIVRQFAKNFRQNLALDLYCGTGTIAQIVSADFKKIVGIELIEEAVLAAKENAEANNIKNCDFYAGDASDVLEKLRKNNFPKGENEIFRIEDPDSIIVDPPREGLSPSALRQIISVKARRLVYVACKPKSLARDLPLLTQAGFSLTKIKAVDMFPYTPHVEAIALLHH